MTLRADVPILIVGQGIAGSVLAMQAKDRGLRFNILDDGHRSASSIAAAGLYNPFILKRRKLSWKGSEFFPVSKAFFQRVEKTLGITLDHEIGIARRVHDVAELNDWTSNEGDPHLSRLIGPALKAEQVSPHLEAPLDYRPVPMAGFVDTEAFLNATKQLFIENGQYIEGRFDEEKVDLEKSLIYDGHEYSAIVICTGYRSQESSRFFPKLPFTPAKGHTVTIHCPDLELETIVSGPCFILPLGESRFRIGSTYSWSDLNESVEEKEVARLMENFHSFCKLPYEIIDSKAGVRPATKDRKPFIGPSILDDRIQIFGGMGSRAIMCAPLLAQMYLEHLLTGGEIWPEVEISRFES